MKHLGRQALGLVLAALLMYGGMLPPVRSYFSIPQTLRITATELTQLNWELPAGLARQIEAQVNNINKTSSMTDSIPDWLHLQLRLFGIVPLRNITLQVVDQVSVFPGGQAIGVLLKTEGAQVIGQAPIIDNKGNKLYPGLQAGLETGDSILAINGQNIKSDQEVAALIDAAGKTNRQVQITVKREERLLTFNIHPLYCQETGRYRIGIYVRDSTAGVGTLTFYEQGEGVFGALGHIVTDSNGKLELNITGGRIIPAAIQGIHQGRQGQPGEKIGMFLENNAFNGIIKKNTDVGIFGTITGNVPSSYNFPIPVALVEKIKPGPAEIMTVLEGEKIEKFTVEIERVMSYQRTSGKGLVIRITDPRLLAMTGGIIQGMSGSPIIQDGNLVGAVTHVFINDPTRGYGVMAEWMLQETNLVNSTSTRGTVVDSPGYHNYLIYTVG